MSAKTYDRQTAKFLGIVGENMPELSGDVMQGWIQNPKALQSALRIALCPPESRVERRPPLLIPVGTVTVAATTTPFIARDRFVVNTKSDAPVKIFYVGDNFKAWFLGKEEQPFGGSTLIYGQLSRRSLDGPIIAKLGGEEKAETTLTELFSLMQAQKHGDSGPLLTNGYANIFYVKDMNGVLSVVHAVWRGVGWDVSAGPVTFQDGWFDECQVFSRNSR